MSERRLWPWALEAYERPGAAAALLQLQDEAGQNIPLLLWAAWARPKPEIVRQGVHLARQWDALAVTPLRRLRRDLKSPLGSIDPTSAEALRQQVKACELEAERLLMEALEGFGGRGTGPLDRALAQAARTWSGDVTLDFAALILALEPAS